jgi:hypothetical protein
VLPQSIVGGHPVSATGKGVMPDFEQTETAEAKFILNIFHFKGLCSVHQQLIAETPREQL